MISEKTGVEMETTWAVFAGASDDTFGIVYANNGVPLLDDDDCARMSARVYSLRAPDGCELLVFGQYTTENLRNKERANCDANWIIGTAAPDSWEESGCFWRWPVEFLTQEKINKIRMPYPAPYSPHLMVTMPVGTLIQIRDTGFPTKMTDNEGIKWGVVK